MHGWIGKLGCEEGEDTFKGAVAVAALAVGLLAECQPSEPTGTTVAVDLSEWTVKPNVTSVASGSVTFRATNKGAIEHKLAVIKTDLAPTALKINAAEAKVEEATSGTTIGEIEPDELQPGKSASATFELASSNYVLFCNIHRALSVRHECFAPSEVIAGRTSAGGNTGGSGRCLHQVCRYSVVANSHTPEYQHSKA